MPKMSRYVKTFRVQVGDKDQKKKMSYFKSDDEVWEKYRAILLR